MFTVLCQGSYRFSILKFKNEFLLFLAVQGFCFIKAYMIGCVWSFLLNDKNHFIVSVSKSDKKPQSVTTRCFLFK